MQKKRTAKKLICILVSIYIVSSFSGCTGNTELKKYKELLKSYEKDEDYKNSTNAIKKASVPVMIKVQFKLSAILPILRLIGLLPMQEN